MNVLLADGGSTKTDWALVCHGKLCQRITAAGINPFHHTAAQITSAIPTFEYTPDVIHFYGAGCTPTQGVVVEQVLQKRFPQARITVGSDLLGAVTALCGSKPGIVCILGTGSNSCHFNGNTVEHHTESLGYILGDEGSGAYIGKLFLQRVLRSQLPQEICEAFFVWMAMTPQEIMKRIYGAPGVNQFLAQCIPFVAQHQHLAPLRALVERAFCDFMEAHLAAYPQAPLHFTGSIAHHFADILRRVAATYGYEVAAIEPRPMEQLIRQFTSQAL